MHAVQKDTFSVVSSGNSYTALSSYLGVDGSVKDIGYNLEDGIVGRGATANQDTGVFT
jgi:hypothetical protein